MKKYKIAVIPGDGTGPEVIREGLKVIEAASRNLVLNMKPKYLILAVKGI